MGFASTLFNGNRDQTLIKRISPSSEQRIFLQEQWNSLADSLKKSLYEKYGYPISTWLQGSYKYGTLIKPLSKNEGYDVDVGVYFEWTDGSVEPAPSQLRSWVQKELIEIKSNNNSIKSVLTPPKKRCSRTIYLNQFHIDTPIYHLDPQRDKRRLACLTDSWESSDPKKLYKWFKNAVNEGDREQLRRIVKYLKGWAAVSFDGAPESRPSSIFLTVIATEAYQSLWASRILGMTDEDALIEIIRKIHERLFSDKIVINPVDGKENLNRIEETAWGGFIPRLEGLKEIAERANEALDEASSAIIWSEAFSFLMPLPETDQIEVIDESSGRAVMQLPEIEIEVYARNPKRFITRHLNEVPLVSKNCDLIFNIKNPHIIPDYATVEWTVRNEGHEADERSDMGHRSLGLRLLKTDEHTAYEGRHFMDCTVRLNGQILALRRVSVNVSAIQAQRRNLPKPSYTKINSLSRRR